MLIVSKFKDYYDYVSALGVDKKIVYNRVNEKTKDDQRINSFSLIARFPYTTEIKNIRKVVVGVTGVLYYGISYKDEKTGEVSYFFDPSKLPEELKKEITNSKKTFMHQFYNKKPLSAWDSIFTVNLQEPFDSLDCPLFSIEVEELSEENRKYGGYVRPVYVLQRNPRLTDYQLSSIVSPETVFQNIDSFISNRNSAEVDTLPISDELKAQTKGFDKSSFRKGKQ